MPYSFLLSLFFSSKHVHFYRASLSVSGKTKSIYLIKGPVCLLLCDLGCRSHKIKTQLLAPHRDFPPFKSQSHRKGLHSFSWCSETPRTLTHQLCSNSYTGRAGINIVKTLAVAFVYLLVDGGTLKMYQIILCTHYSTFSLQTGVNRVSSSNRTPLKLQVLQSVEIFTDFKFSW